MSQRMLIDARHPEETRVAVVNGQRIEEFDFEAADRKQLKGNIYLAKVTRVEPSLQAAFVEYGGNRHGFLAFSEIHPDYYQIPKEDRDALLKEEQELHAEEAHDDEEHEGEDEVVATGGHDDTDSLRRQRQALRRRYKIQEVIRRRQVLLIQVVKEERGNKGAALTTYLSLAGRYCVLMPNTAHGGGISRKISNMADRRRLKSIMADLRLPAGMGAIVRTAGLKRGKADIKRDFEYLTRLWDEIRETTLASTAPCLVHEDSGLIKRAVRDLYNKDIDQILVDGPEGFEAAHRFMSMLMPTHAPKVMQYDDAVPLFQRFGVEAQLAAMYQPVVQLKSGGYLVINPTEALVSIDINSGRSTREHGIEETAFKTNMEAAEEIGRQLRLRDMAGLVVIDFIDMEVNGNNRRVERAMKDALRHDRARIQLGRISSFGLMEMSRQRLRTGILEASTHVCPMCDGSGYVRAVASAALAALRDLEAEAIKGRCSEFTLRAGPDVAVYILNRKRAELAELEERYGVGIEAVPDESLMGPNYVIDAGGPAPTRQIVLAPIPAPVSVVDDEEEYVAADTGDDEDDEEEGDTPREARAPRPEGERGDRERGGRGRRRRRGGGRDRAAGDEAPADVETIEGDASADGEAVADDTIEVVAEPVGETDADATKRRRRGRRGGRRREGGAERADEPVTAEAETVEATPEPELELVTEPEPAPEPEVPAKRPRRGRKAAAAVEPVAEDAPPPAPPAADPVEEAPVEAVKAPRKRAPRRKAGEPAAEPVAAADEAPPAPPAAKAPVAEAPANDAASEAPANDAGEEAPVPAGEPRKGWWSRTFGA
ncbi:Rne/Rng family ribonuclease [Glacieibacterium frigidum]|uniref:Ribonuclease E n=1 Tax=Glacieibacterium frigidum TaxID=2593303 RepID=A0A552UFP9_9SPHN|nr:ribonuclease E/G [Glacieibacterium frigidum]TRW17047.1 ribonuclease E/G [Glacieibacterium frigidum]